MRRRNISKRVLLNMNSHPKLPPASNASTSSGWDEAGQAAVDSREKDSGIIRAGDGGFADAATKVLSHRETLLKQLTTRRKRG